jgi:hypothetical protein
MDDLLVFSKTFNEHLLAIETVLQKARERNLKFRTIKCKLFLDRLEFLKHEVEKKGSHTSQKKVKVIQQIQIPTTVKQALSFICLAGYYRKFIKNFAEISKPIHTVVHTEPFKWTPECQKAFEKIKAEFENSIVLAYPDFEKPFELKCDTSKIQIGMILSQKDDQANSRSIHFANS